MSVSLTLERPTTCSICHEFLNKAVFSCRNNHPICGQCFETAHDQGQPCSQGCGSVLKRDYVTEHVLYANSKVCETKGCFTNLLPDQPHDCLYALYKCPGCDDQVSTIDIFDHFKDGACTPSYPLTARTDGSVMYVCENNILFLLIPSGNETMYNAVIMCCDGFNNDEYITVHIGSSQYKQVVQVPIVRTMRDVGNGIGIVLNKDDNIQIDCFEIKFVVGDRVMMQLPDNFIRTTVSEVNFRQRMIWFRDDSKNEYGLDFKCASQLSVATDERTTDEENAFLDNLRITMDPSYDIEAGLIATRRSEAVLQNGIHYR